MLSHAHRVPSKPAAPTAEKRATKLPAVDERLVAPEMRFEIIGGKVEYVPPAGESHGSRHSKITALLEAYAAEGYDVATDMLTRTSEKGDMAPDASVFPRARDPRTGGRQLEELAFEVLSTERLAHAARKARALTERGVRRVFAIDVEQRRALVWSASQKIWDVLPPDSKIEDRALALPLPIRALVEAAKPDDAVAQALITKKNPVITSALQRASQAGERRGKLEGKLEGKIEGRIEGHLEGQLEGRIEALLAVLDARGLEIKKKQEKRIRAERDEATLAGWIRAAASCTSIGDLLGK
jgi:Uma2 family endonuclease